MNSTLENWAFFKNCLVCNICFYLRKLCIIWTWKELHQVGHVIKGLLRKYTVIKVFVLQFLGFIHLLHDEIPLKVLLTIRLSLIYTLKLKISTCNCLHQIQGKRFFNYLKQEDIKLIWKNWLKQVTVLCKNIMYHT